MNNSSAQGNFNWIVFNPEHQLFIDAITNNDVQEVKAYIDERIETDVFFKLQHRYYILSLLSLDTCEAILDIYQQHQLFNVEICSDDDLTDFEELTTQIPTKYKIHSFEDHVPLEMRKI